MAHIGEKTCFKSSNEKKQLTLEPLKVGLPKRWDEQCGNSCNYLQDCARQTIPIAIATKTASAPDAVAYVFIFGTGFSASH